MIGMASYDTPTRSLYLEPARARSEWTALLEMIPAGFDFMSPARVARQGLEMISNASNTSRYLSVLSAAQHTLRQARVPIIVREHNGETALLVSSDLKRTQRRWLGQLTLELYFAQVFRSSTALLDLWPSRIGINNAGDAVWNPRPYYVRWAPNFINPLRDVYAGFFLGDQQRFEGGLEKLGLGSAGGLLLRHLGEGNQRGVRFSSARLQSTLREMSSLPLGGQGRPHRNFAAFALYVGSLHEFLESLDTMLDVRSAFMRSYAKSVS